MTTVSTLKIRRKLQMKPHMIRKMEVMQIREEINDMENNRKDK